MNNQKTSDVVDFELRGKSLLDPNLVCRVAGCDADSIAAADIRLDVNNGAYVTLRMLPRRGLNLSLPAAVTVHIEAYDYTMELVEEPLADGGRRFYVRPRE